MSSSLITFDWLVVDGRGLLSSASELAEKTSVYSTLVGILNAKKFEFGEEVRRRVAASLSIMINCF